MLKRLALLAAPLILQAHGVAGQAGQDKYAPLPEKVVNAKTVFYINDTTSSRFGDDLYQEIRKWEPLASGAGTSAPIKSSSWHIFLIDPGNGQTVWISSHTMGGRLWQSWGSVARSLLSDIQKRMK